MIRRVLIFMGLLAICGLIAIPNTALKAQDEDTQRPPILLENIRELNQLAWLGTGPVYDVQWSGFNNLLAVSNDAGVWLYDSETLNFIGRLGLGTEISDFSPYGSRLATTHDNIVRIWDALTGEERTIFEGHTNRINSVQWSPDGKMLAAASGTLGSPEGQPGALLIWDTETLELLHTFGGNVNDPDFAARNLAWSPDSELIAAITDGGKVTVWDIESGDEALIIDINYEFRHELAWSPNGNTLVVAGGDGAIQIYDANQGGLIDVLPTQAEATWELAFHPDGTILASGHREGVVIFWNTFTWEMIRRIQVNQDDILSLAFSPEGDRLAAAGSDELVKIIAVETGQQADELTAHSGAAWDATFSGNSETIYSSGALHRIDAWNTRTWEYETIYPQSESISQIVASPNGEWLAVEGRGVLVESNAVDVALFLLRPDGQRTVLLAEVESVLSVGRGVVFSPDGSLLAAVVDDVVKVWTVDTGQELFSFTTQDPLIENELKWSPLGGQLALTSRNSDGNGATLWVWDMTSGETQIELTHDQQISDVTWSFEGIQLATVDVSGNILEQADVADSAVQIWDAQSGTQRALLQAHSDEVRVLKWSPDGGKLATGGSDNSVRIWDTSTGDMLYNMGVSDDVQAIRWSPNARLLLIEAVDESLWIYDGISGTFLTSRHFADAGDFEWSPDGRLILENIGGTVRVWGIPWDRDCLITAERSINRRWGPNVKTASTGVIEPDDVWVAFGQGARYLHGVWWQLADLTWVRSDVVEESATCEGLPFLDE